MFAKKSLMLGLFLIICLIPLGIVTAQDDAVCGTALDDVLAQVAESCAEVGSGEACFGAGESPSFAEIGEVIPLADLESIETIASDDTLGIVQLSVASESEDAPIQLALYGNSQITNATTGLPAELPELPVSNKVGYDINLRENGGTQFPVVTTLPWNGSAIADGRTADSTWIRLQTNNGIAWGWIELLNVDGDLNELLVLDSPYTEPMQAITLETAINSEDCGGSSGLLVNYSGQGRAKMQINQLDLEFEAGSFIVEAQADESLSIRVLDNPEVRIERAEGHIAAKTGESLEVPLEGLRPAEEPVANPSFSFVSVEGAPLNLSGENAVCIAGISLDASADGFDKPEADTEASVSLDPAAHYAVNGYTEDDDGNRWLQVQQGQTVSWVPEQSVRTAGLCSNIVELDASAPVVVNTTSNNVPDVSGVLASQTVWQANSGQEVSSGTCNFPPLAMCQHLVAISPNGDGSIAWRGQEPTPYTLYGEGNFYSFSGRNKLNNGNITMALNIQGENSWTMTMTQVFDNDPECIRTFNYTASRNW